MRRIDVIGIGVGMFVAGGVLYWLLQGAGLSSVDAGIWSQAILVGGVIGWLITYLIRAFTHKMTYNQQLQDYEDAVLQQRLAEMTPEELEALQAEVEKERQQQDG